MRHELHSQVRPRVRAYVRRVRTQRTGSRFIASNSARPRVHFRMTSVLSRNYALLMLVCVSPFLFFSPRYINIRMRGIIPAPPVGNAKTLLYAGGKCRIITSGILSRDVFFLLPLPPSSPDADVIFREHGSYFCGRAIFVIFTRSAFNWSENIRVVFTGRR